jgi:hypothetical protein
VFTHIVLFKFKTPDPAEFQRVRDRLMAMQGKIPELVAIEVGIDELRTDRSFDVSLLTRFNSAEDMQAYQVNPIHQEVVAYLRPLLDMARAVDYTG